MHDLIVINTLAGALAAALVFGWITQRLGLSTLVGYMLAGIAVGPFTPGFVADSHLASQMAEIGVILLMFGVGMHFHPQDLLRVWRIAVPGAIAQSALAAAAGWASARLFGWSHTAGIVFGMALAVASTVVLMRMLVEQDRLSSRDGHVAVGWLIVEDLFTVVALVVLPSLALEDSSAGAVALGVATGIGKAAVFAALVWIVGTRVVAPVIERLARTRSSELFTLMVFVLALGVALVASEVFHVSVALGAFFAGLVVGQSRFGTQAATDMAPFRDVFSALFFVSIGMLFNPAFVTSKPWMVAAALGIVLILKPLVALAIVMLMRDTLRTGLTVAVGLAQIGEFSFILAVLGQSLGILPEQGMDVLVVTAIVSIAINPLLFRALAAFEARSKQQAEVASASARADIESRDAAYPVVVTGLGELGQRLIRRCLDTGVHVCAVGNEAGQLEELRSPDLRKRGLATVLGDAGQPHLLKAAGLDDARIIVVTNVSLPEKMRICIAAREVNPRIAIIATAESTADRVWLQEFGATYICDALDEMTAALLRSVRSGI
jgi:CPA2 family monovalent cation:H+ antiporter-2